MFLLMCKLIISTNYSNLCKLSITRGSIIGTRMGLTIVTFTKIGLLDFPPPPDDSGMGYLCRFDYDRPELRLSLHARCTSSPLPGCGWHISFLQFLCACECLGKHWYVSFTSPRAILSETCTLLGSSSSLLGSAVKVERIIIIHLLITF